VEEYKLNDGLEPLAARGVIGDPGGISLYAVFQCTCGELVWLEQIGVYVMCQCGKAYALQGELLIAESGEITATVADIAQYWLDAARNITHAKKEERAQSAS